MDANQLYRLMIIDTQLATTGVDLGASAADLGITPAALCRDLELLLSVGCEITVRPSAGGNRYFYACERLFNPEHGAVNVSSMVARNQLPAFCDPPPRSSRPCGAATESTDA